MENHKRCWLVRVGDAPWRICFLDIMKQGLNPDFDPEVAWWDREEKNYICAANSGEEIAELPE